MAFGQMGWGQPMYGGYMLQTAMPDQLAQLRAQQQFTPQMAGMQMPAQPPAQQNAPIWVQGEAGAKSFLVAPGQSLILMDSEAEVFYIKSTDASGVPLPLRIFDYKERAGSAQRPVQAAQTPSVEYVTRAEFDALTAKINELTAKEAPVRRRVNREMEGEIDA